jgi:hypothetical protein
METTSLNELKKTLNALNKKELLELSIRMIRYKRENKELVSYLLYFAGNEKDYIRSVEGEIDKYLEEINRSNSYFTMKGIRKALRMTNKFIKFSGNRQTEVEVLLYFCTKLRKQGIMVNAGTSLLNLYQRQILKIRKAITNLHEDLQFDYGKELDLLL